MECCYVFIKSDKRTGQTRAGTKCTRPVAHRGLCHVCYTSLKNRLSKEELDSLYPFSQEYLSRHRIVKVNLKSFLGVCTICGPRAEIVVQNYRGKDKYYCLEARRISLRKIHYKTKKQFLGRNCEICGTKERLCYDHNHRTGKFRGTLCHNCNAGIGFLGDSLKKLKKAVLYLKSKQKS